MREPHEQSTMTNKSSRPWLIAILFILLLVLSWYFILPLFGITIAAVFVATAASWGIAVATVVLLSVFILLGFVVGSVAAVILSLFAIFWTIFAICLFPFFFPLFVPLLILLLVIHLWRRKRIL